MSRLTRDSMKEENRPKRIPVSEANRDKMTVAGLDNDNFVYRWVNDSEGRLATFVAGYWEFVDQTGQPIGDGGIEQSAGVGSKFSKGVGQGVTAYLMRIPRDIWLEDQQLKENDVKQIEAEMKRTAKQAGDYGRVEVTVKS